jgi:hypothetical protein
MENHNFKIGDKVRIIGNGDGTSTDVVHHHFAIGDVGTIKRASAFSDLYVRVGSLYQYVSPCHVELIEDDNPTPEIKNNDPMPEIKNNNSMPEIKDGYLLVVETHGEKHNMTVVHNDNDELGCVTPDKHFWNVRNFDVDGDYWGSKIVAIYGRTYNKYLLENSIARRELLWERKEPKKMTVAEICEALGYEIEIVTED